MLAEELQLTQTSLLSTYDWRQVYDFACQIIALIDYEQLRGSATARLLTLQADFFRRNFPDSAPPLFNLAIAVAVFEDNSPPLPLLFCRIVLFVNLRLKRS